MQLIRPPVRHSASASRERSLTVAGCRKEGERFALPNSRASQTAMQFSYYGQASDIARHAQEVVKLKHRLNEIYAKHTGRTMAEIEKALDRDTYMTAEEAKAFGIIDQVMSRRPEGPDGL
jgi:ATP-dependent Clp protease protease subunit